MFGLLKLAGKSKLKMEQGIETSGFRKTLFYTFSFNQLTLHFKSCNETFTFTRKRKYIIYSKSPVALILVS